MPRPWNSSAVHQFICITFSFFSRKTFKAQHKSVLLFIPRCYVGEALSNAKRSRQLVLGLTANPPEMSSGLEIIREHSHLAEPDIRHILFSTRSLPHFTTCLHSNPRQQDTIRGWSWTSFTEYFVKRSGWTSATFSRQKIPSINKVTNFIIISML